MYSGTAFRPHSAIGARGLAVPLKRGRMPSIRGRIVFDIALSALLVFEMLYQFTGNALHEIVGAAFFACIVVHLGFAAKWIGSFARAVGAGTVARRQRRLGIVAGLLALDVVLLGFSSVVISQSLWDAGIDLSFLNPGNIWYPVHTVTAYALSILVIGHLVMHWANVADALKIAYDSTRREAISSALNGVVMVGGIALGVVGLMQAVFKLPLLKHLDWLAGGAFGLVRGGLILYVIFLLIPILSTVIPLDAFNELLAQSTLAPVFQSDGFFVKVITGKL